MPSDQSRLQALSLHLRRRRDELVRLWRDAIRRDPELATNASLPYGALDDHIPKILEDFERRLWAEHAIAATLIDLEQRQDAAEHGMHRWQQGYDIRETMREWGHLQAVLLRELDGYAAGHPEVEPSAMRAARETLAALCMEGNCESASRYVRLQQAEAASRVRELEGSLHALQALENERAMLLRETAHDLRGSVGVLANTTALLAKPQLGRAQRAHFYDVLQQRIRSMSALLTDLVELARLEAGQDPLRIETFDAAERVRECCEDLRSIAAERNLFLKCEGPEQLMVEGDLLKLQRIVQNLLLNALTATEQGGVVVRWCLDTAEGARQWRLSVADTGPGLSRQAEGPLQHALKRATDEARKIEAAAARRTGEGAGSGSIDREASRSERESPALPSGEGIGLSIVKRLCELLHATVELETSPGAGTTIRIAFPLRYSQSSLS
jgi:signal transduction histidine kinase